MKRVVSQTSAGVHVCTPAADVDPASLAPAGAPYIIVDATALPTAPIAAWAIVNDEIVVDAAVATAAQASALRAQIEWEMTRRIDTALAGRSASMLREAAWLQMLVSQGKTLSANQSAEVTMFEAINAWEAAMVDKREALIGSNDAAASAIDGTWPPPPAGLGEFLRGF